jgi:hypothetical protein
MRTDELKKIVPLEIRKETVPMTATPPSSRLTPHVSLPSPHVSRFTPHVSRLMLGTVQFGLPYGVANRTGQPEYREVLAILAAAIEGGAAIRILAAGTEKKRVESGRKRIGS